MASSFQLPALKGLSPYKSHHGSNVSKNLRFCPQPMMGRSSEKVHVEKDTLDGCSTSKKSFLKDNDWEDISHGQEYKEHKKFKELQKNQDMLRNIGRANLREKRMSLIRLPTITSAKKRRQTTWDSGKNVSRPAGKSTAFETYPYLEDSVQIKKKNFKIPAIRDPKRSEIQLDPDVPRQPDQHKRKKVQFTRPGEVGAAAAVSNPNLTLASIGGSVGLNASSVTSVSSSTMPVAGTDETMMGGESLNTTLADTTMGDTSFQHIHFDAEQMKVLAQLASGDKTAASGDTSGASTERRERDASLDTAAGAGVGIGKSTEGKTTDKNQNQLEVPGSTNDKPTDLPPLKIKTLMRKNVILHELNTPGLRGGGAGPGKGNWDRASDLSVLTKISRLSLETEEWKNSYMSLPDPETRKKTLSDIMFAVRTRMRENEASLRFGETPRPSDESYGFLLADPFQQKSPRRSNKSPRKVVKGQSVRGAASLSLSTKKRAAPGGGDQGGKTAAQLQGYLRRVFRHRRAHNPGNNTSNSSSRTSKQHGTGSQAGPGVGEKAGGGGENKLKQPCSQEAAKLDRHRGIQAMPVAQQA
ncbi:hypothetical protein EGW08_015086 [Elysia chlorotica]|uniref:Uncharacterized protein n=1 Tax=Elysia chlorotica TaxID=188477 RepID=A0A3S1BX35_ELYCH|nr:hypothetical protein EGW08_015086 [Elysia chlorotica]